jgi:hypothetical protein
VRAPAGALVPLGRWCRLRQERREGAEWAGRLPWSRGRAPALPHRPQAAHHVAGLVEALARLLAALGHRVLPHHAGDGGLVGELLLALLNDLGQLFSGDGEQTDGRVDEEVDGPLDR